MKGQVHVDGEKGEWKRHCGSRIKRDLKPLPPTIKALIINSVGSFEDLTLQ